MTFLTGEKILLRSPKAEDFSETMVKWVNDRDVTRYLWRGTFPGNLAEFAQEFEQLKDSKNDVQLSICEVSSGRTVGVTGLHGINWVSRLAEFRILIGEKDAWGGGLGTETLYLMAAYGFEVLNLNKVWLGVNLGNRRAYDSYLKASFKVEGELRDEVYRNGRYYNVVRMSLLKSEYQNEVQKWPAYPHIKTQLRVQE